MPPRRKTSITTRALLRACAKSCARLFPFWMRAIQLAIASIRSSRASTPVMNLRRRVRNEAESNERMRQEAWDFLLGLAKWPVKTRQMTIDLSNGTASLFSDIAATVAPYAKEQTLEVEWQRRLITGTVSMRDLLHIDADKTL